MEITFATAKLERTLATKPARVREFGPDAAERLYARMVQLHDAPTLAVMRTLPGGCHELKGERAHQLALTVTRGLRLIFVPTEEPRPEKTDGGLDWSAVTAITIVEVTDYHG